MLLYEYCHHIKNTKTIFTDLAVVITNNIIGSKFLNIL